MKHSSLFGTLALLLLSGFSFSMAGLEQCAYQEEDCMHNCCVQAGGTPETVGEYVDCVGSTADPEASGEAYDNCIMSSCRPASIECVAPSSGCRSEYQNCFSSCVAGGTSAKNCDDQCFTDATGCMGAYLENQGSTGGSSCCGSAFILGFALLGAFAARNR